MTPAELEAIEKRKHDGTLTYADIEAIARQFPTYAKAGRNYHGSYYEDVHWELRNKYQPKN
jgi:hypothetical protein